MSHFSQMMILPIPPDHSSESPAKGARRVVGIDENGKSHKAGWLMPPFKDSRQQPKSLAFRLLEERVDMRS